MKHFDKNVHKGMLLDYERMYMYVLSQQIYIYTVKSQYLEVDGTIFYKFKLPEVQINLHFG